MYLNAKEKGETGEAIVYKEIEAAVSCLDFSCKIVSNAIFPFESVYGERGYITAEIDIVVFTPYLVFLFEVKNEIYSKAEYTEPLWYLMDNEPVSNPIEQNHGHKEVFCSELNIPREQVITIEVLLENGISSNIKSVYPNDYVFSLEDLKRKIVYLLSTTYRETIDIEAVYRRFSSMLNKRIISAEEHISTIKRTEKIETRIKKCTWLHEFASYRCDILSVLWSW